MHTLSIASAAQMGEPGSGKQAASGFLGMVDRRQDAPFRLSAVDRVIIEQIVRCPLAYQIAQFRAFGDR